MAEDKMIEQKEHQSKIVSLKITNFMSIKSGLIEFDEQNIISLCGYNDSGKSAITRLLEVMLYNAYSTDQVKFITDEEDYWEGVLTFSDGVVYSRRKYADGRSLWELSKDGKVLFTNKLPNGTYAAMSDTPEVIEKYLGVIQDELTGEELNVRRNTDKLFLINTSGGDNYKILNSVLRSDVLSAASKNLNDDKNKLKAEVDEKTTIKGVLEEQLNETEVAPQEEIDDVSHYIANLEKSKSRITQLSVLMEENKKKHDIVLYDELKALDISRLRDLQNIIDLVSQKNVVIYDALGRVDIDRLNKLKEIFGCKKELKGNLYDELNPVDTGRLQSLKTIADLFNTLAKAKKSFENVSDQLEKTKGKLKELSIEHNLKVCPNCGTIVS